jgi:hypothetical protein
MNRIVAGYRYAMPSFALSEAMIVIATQKTNSTINSTIPIPKTHTRGRQISP